MKNILGKTIPGLILVCLMATGCPSKSPASTDTTAVIDTTSNTTAVVDTTSNTTAVVDTTTSTTNVFAYSTTVIQHFGMGFDFSTGLPAVSNDERDGETIGWMPGNDSSAVYPNWSVYIWWRNENLDPITFLNQTKDMGVVDISTVTGAPASWDVSPNFLPLLPGHTIVAKCKDGYAKFEVITTDTTIIPNASAMGWPALVRYYYSPSATFAH